MSLNVWRIDEFGDVDLDEPAGYNMLESTGVAGSKFSLFQSITSHRLPPGINSTSGDDDGDEDSGIDVAGVAGRLANFSSLALGHWHPALSQKYGAHEEYADLENVRANEIILEVGSSNQRVSLDDWSLGQTSSAKQTESSGLGEANSSSGGLKRQKSGGGLKRAMTSPGSLTDLGSQAAHDISDDKFSALKEKLDSIGSVENVSETRAVKSSGGASFSVGGHDDDEPMLFKAGASEFEPKAGSESSSKDLVEEVPRKGGLSRCKTMPGSLARLHENEEDETETSVSKHVSQPSSPPSELASMSNSPSPDPAPYKSTILSHFFSRQDAKPILEEDVADGMKPIAKGSLTEKASHFSAANAQGALETLTKKKTKVRRRDLNMWAPGGT